MSETQILTRVLSTPESKQEASLNTDMLCNIFNFPTVDQTSTPILASPLLTDFLAPTNKMTSDIDLRSQMNVDPIDPSVSTASSAHERSETPRQRSQKPTPCQVQVEVKKEEEVEQEGPTRRKHYKRTKRTSLESLHDLSVRQLKTECRKRHLRRSCAKADLIRSLLPFEADILSTMPDYRSHLSDAASQEDAYSSMSPSNDDSEAALKEALIERDRLKSKINAFIEGETDQVTVEEVTRWLLDCRQISTRCRELSAGHHSPSASGSIGSNGPHKIGRAQQLSARHKEEIALTDMGNGLDRPCHYASPFTPSPVEHRCYGYQQRQPRPLGCCRGVGSRELGLCAPQFYQQPHQSVTRAPMPGYYDPQSQLQMRPMMGQSTRTPANYPWSMQPSYYQQQVYPSNGTSPYYQPPPASGTGGLLPSMQSWTAGGQDWNCQPMQRQQQQRSGYLASLLLETSTQTQAADQGVYLGPTPCDQMQLSAFNQSTAASSTGGPVQLDSNGSLISTSPQLLPALPSVGSQLNHEALPATSSDQLNFNSDDDFLSQFCPAVRDSPPAFPNGIHTQEDLDVFFHNFTQLSQQSQQQQSSA